MKVTLAQLNPTVGDVSGNLQKVIATLEKRQGLKVACPEEVASRKGYIDAAQVERLTEPLKKTAYGQYLLRMLKEKVF